MNQVSEVKMQLRLETQKLFPKEATMLSAPDQCEHMQFMIKLAGCKRGIEVGVFTGYSALCFA